MARSLVRPTVGLRMARGVRGAALAALAALTGAKVRTMRAARLPPPPRGMAWVHGGTIVVGHTPEELDAECKEIGKGCDRDLMQREVPRTVVEVEPFLMDVNEVTNQEMAETLDTFGSLRITDDEDTHLPRFVSLRNELGAADGYLVDLTPPYIGIERVGRRYQAKAGLEQQPVVQVTWEGARFFCRSRGKILPTENQWEAAARGVDDRPFPWGRAPIRCGGVVVPFDGLIRMDATCPSTVGVANVGTATQDTTPEGIHDLAGNVSEWLESSYVEGNRSADGATAADLPRVIRGGSFGDSFMARTSGRFRRLPNSVGANVGFRCAIPKSMITKKE